VPNVRDLLDRFRPAGPPGAASSVAVPADRRADAEQELAGVFAALADVERQCAQVRADAEHDAARRKAQSQRMTAAIVARARTQATAERAAAAAAEVRAAQEEAARILQEAQQSAARARSAAEQRLPDLVDRVVARAWAHAEAAGLERSG